MIKFESPATREAIFTHIRQILADNFDLAEEAITLGANLYEDLDIDSIDAVDIMVVLKNTTGKRLDPDAFKGVRTVDDIVSAVFDLLNG